MKNIIFIRFNIRSSDFFIFYLSPVQTVPELEEMLGISFTVFSFFDDAGRGLYKMYNTKHERVRHVDLLYYNGHYAWIKNVGKLVGCLSKDGHKVFYYKNCGSRFILEKEFTRHKQLCTSENWCSLVHTLFNPGYVLEFKNFKYQTPAPFVIYIDCESKTEPINEHKGNTTYYQRHECISAAALLVLNF